MDEMINDDRCPICRNLVPEREIFLGLKINGEVVPASVFLGVNRPMERAGNMVDRYAYAMRQTRGSVEFTTYLEHCDPTWIDGGEYSFEIRHPKLPLKQVFEAICTSMVSRIPMHDVILMAFEWEIVSKIEIVETSDTGFGLFIASLVAAHDSFRREWKLGRRKKARTKEKTRDDDDCV